MALPQQFPREPLASSSVFARVGDPVLHYCLRPGNSYCLVSVEELQFALKLVLKVEQSKPGMVVIIVPGPAAQI